MDSEFTTSMVPPSNPGSSLGSTPNRVLTMTRTTFHPLHNQLRQTNGNEPILMMNKQLQHTSKL